MPQKGKSLAEKAAAEIEARKARDAAQAHLKKAGQVVGNPYAKHVSRRPTSRDNTLSQVRSRQQASARAAVAKADAIAAALPGAEYDPVRFSGLVLRLDDPAASLILFRSGIVVVTDVGSEAGVKRALKALEKFLRASSLLS